MNNNSRFMKAALFALSMCFSCEVALAQEAPVAGTINTNLSAFSSNPEVGTTEIYLNDSFWGTSHGGEISNVSAQNPLDLTAESGGISINMNSNSEPFGYINASETRVYAGYSMSFSVPVSYVITKLEFVPTTDANSWPKVTHKPNVGKIEKSATVWTDGSAKLVSIVFGGKCYITSVKVTVAKATEITANIQAEEGYGTFCNENAYVLSEGLAGATANIVDNELVWNWQYNAGDIVPARTPILLHGETGDHKVYKTSSELKVPANNYLFANLSNSDVAANSLAQGCATFYALSYGLGSNSNKLGFYWMENDGASFNVPAEKVFLALPENVQAKSRILFATDDETETDIISLSNSCLEGQMFNLSGQRVNDSHKGIVIVNGKKVFNK